MEALKLPPDSSRERRARALKVLERIDRSWAVLFAPPSWHWAIGHAIELLKQAICPACGAHPGDNHAGFCARRLCVLCQGRGFTSTAEKA